MPGALHFVTGNVVNRKPIFRQDEYCRAFLEEMQEMRFSRECKIISFVSMPEHFHFVANPRDGDIQTATGMLKGFSAKSIVSVAPVGTFFNGDENQIWQESFKALPLWSGWMIQQKINYIHANPVKATLCSTAADYPWTSFRSVYLEEPDPLLIVDKDWFWEGVEKILAESIKQFEEEKRNVLMEQIEENRKRAGASPPS